MSLFRKKAASNINYLELIPFQVKESEECGDIIKLLIPKFKSKFFLNLIPESRSKFVRVKLDELGSSVWKTIDGKKNVSTIIAELSDRFGERIHPAEERVLKFLTQLFQSNFINFKKIKKET